MKSISRQFALLITVFVGGWLNAAGPSDLKTFNPQESYVVEGLSIVLTQKLGEATVKVGSAVNDPTSLTAANGAKFDRDRELPNEIGIYKMQSSGTLSEADSKAALDSLNEDARIEYAYPVYVNASTGQRHFLEDELVVRLNMPLGPAPTNLFSPFKLAVTHTLNAKENI